jgi:dipeptidase E
MPYGGETRDDRLREFHEMNDAPVLGLWEGSLLAIDGPAGTIGGTAGGRLFLKGEAPQELAVGAELPTALLPTH